MNEATTVRLRDLGEWMGGNTPSKANAAYWTNGTIPWVSPKDMKVDEIASSEDRITEAALADGRVSMVPEGSVLLVTRSGILARTLPVAVTKLPVTINQDLKALTPKAGVSPKYVAHAMRGASRRILKQCSKHGTTVASIETKALLDFEIPIVELDEQHRIVAEIEKQFSRLDEAAASLKRIKAKLERYSAIVLGALHDGSLTAEEEGALAIGSSQWAVAKIRDVVEVIDYRGRTPPFSESGIPHLRSSNIRTGKILWKGVAYVTEDTYAQYMTRGLPRRGDILFTTEAPLGEVAPVPDCRFSVAQRIMLLRPDSSRLNSDFLALLIRSPQFQRKLRKSGTGSTVTGVSSRNFQPLEIAIPPLTCQRSMTEEANRLLSIAGIVDVQIEAALIRAQRLRAILLHTALSTKSNALNGREPKCS